MSLDTLLKSLGLSTIRAILPELIPIAEQQAWSYQQLLERLVSEEVAQHSERRTATLIAKAKIPFEATIDTFDFTFRSDLNHLSSSQPLFICPVHSQTSSINA